MFNRGWVLCVTLVFGGWFGSAFALSEEEQLKRYVLGNTLTTLYHEFGHAFVTEFELPVVGKEEDAVDTFSVVELTYKLFDEDTSDDRAEELDYYLWATIDAWLAIAERDEDGHDAFDYAGEHSLDIQRFYSHLCLVYGSDPDYHGELIEAYDVDPEIVETCEDTFEIAADAWAALLINNDALRAEGAPREDSIEVFINDGGKAFATYANWLRDWHWLSDLEATIETDFALSEPLSLIFESCGEANAWWDPEAGAVTLCYEIMDEYAQLFADDS